MNPGQTLSLVRQMRGLSQLDIANQLNIARTLISELENSRRPMTQQYRDRLRGIGIDVDNDAINAAIIQLAEAINGRPQPS